MTNWIMSANPAVYDHESAFRERGYIDWKQTRNFAVGDIVYIYCTKPLGRIRFKTVVSEVNKYGFTADCYWRTAPPENTSSMKCMRLKYLNESNSDELSFTALKGKGMNYPPQSPCRVNGDLLLSIERCFGGTEK